MILQLIPVQTIISIFFTKSITSFIKKLRIKNLTIAGESIHATLAASVSVELPKVVKKNFNV